MVKMNMGFNLAQRLGEGVVGSRIKGAMNIRPEFLQRDDNHDDLDALLSAFCDSSGLDEGALLLGLHAISAQYQASNDPEVRPVDFELTTNVGVVVRPCVLTSANPFKFQPISADAARLVSGIKITVDGGQDSDPDDVVDVKFYGRRTKPERFAIHSGGKEVFDYTGMLLRGVHYIEFTASGWTTGNDVRVYVDVEGGPVDQDFLTAARGKRREKGGFAGLKAMNLRQAMRGANTARAELAKNLGEGIKAGVGAGSRGLPAMLAMLKGRG